VKKIKVYQPVDFAKKKSKLLPASWNHLWKHVLPHYLRCQLVLVKLDIEIKHLLFSYFALWPSDDSRLCTSYYSQNAEVAALPHYNSVSALSHPKTGKCPIPQTFHKPSFFHAPNGGPEELQTFSTTRGMFLHQNKRTSDPPDLSIALRHQLHDPHIGRPNTRVHTCESPHRNNSHRRPSTRALPLIFCPEVITSSKAPDVHRSTATQYTCQRQASGRIFSKEKVCQLPETPFDRTTVFPMYR
jgi:hypothetical protein